MNRRNFLSYLFAALTLGGMLTLAGCGKKETKARLGNQEKNWKMSVSKEEIAAPLELDYAKDGPAAYRDSSLSKQDPSFVPKTGGG